MQNLQQHLDNATKLVSEIDALLDEIEGFVGTALPGTQNSADPRRTAAAISRYSHCPPPPA